MTVPKIIAIFVVLLIVNLAAMLTGLVYRSARAHRESSLGALFRSGSSCPRRSTRLLIAVLAVVVQVLSPNKYVGWGIIFVWFVGGIFLSNMGCSNPLYTYGQAPERAAERFQRAGQLLERRGGVPCSTGLLFAADPRRHRPPAVAARNRPWAGRADQADAPACHGDAARRLPAIAAVAMAATGAYAYHNIKQLNRYQTSDEAEKYQADYEKKISASTRSCRSRRSPTSSSTCSSIPKQRRLIANGSYDLVNKTDAPIRDVHVRQRRPRRRISRARL